MTTSPKRRQIRPFGPRAFVALLVMAAGVNWADAKTIEQAFEHYTNGEYRKAYLIARELAESGDVEAQYAVGTMFLYGHGTSVDLKRAVQWLERSAKAGHADALATIYSVYAPLSKYEPNPQKALFWTNEAIERGYGRGYLQLGFLLNYGWGVRQDRFLAYKNYKKAAELGVSAAFLNISLMHEAGSIGFISLSKSYAWALLAKKAGFDAEKHIQSLKNKMNDTDQKTGIEYAEECSKRGIAHCQ